MYLIFYIFFTSQCNKPPKRVFKDPQTYINIHVPSSFSKNYIKYVLKKPPIIQYGISTYYHKKFHNRKTATGDKFREELWTGAHKELPIPSIALLLYYDNNTVKGVIILLNDRGPYVGGRMLDVSQSLARKINLFYKGGKKVAIILLKNETAKLIRNKKYTPVYKGILNFMKITKILRDNNIKIINN